MGPLGAFFLGGIVSYVGRKPIRKAAKRAMKGAIVVGRSVKGLAHGITEDWEDAKAEVDDDSAKKAAAASEAPDAHAKASHKADDKTS
jgi:hypothetical protein